MTRSIAICAPKVTVVSHTLQLTIVGLWLALNIATVQMEPKLQAFHFVHQEHTPHSAMPSLSMTVLSALLDSTVMARWIILRRQLDHRLAFQAITVHQVLHSATSSHALRANTMMALAPNRPMTASIVDSIITVQDTERSRRPNANLAHTILKPHQLLNVCPARRVTSAHNP